MWSRKPRPVRDRARGRCRRAAEPHLDAVVSRVRRAAARPDGARRARRSAGRRLAAGELGQRAQQPVVWRRRCATVDAEAVGQQRLVRERAHDAAALDQAGERRRVDRRAGEHEVARLGQHLDAGARACPRPAGRAPRRSPRSAPRISSRSRQRQLGRRPPTTTRSSRAAAARRARSASAGCGEAVADARRAEREALRERAADDQVLVLGDQSERSSPPSSRYAWSSTTMPGQAGTARSTTSRVELLAGRVVRAAQPDEPGTPGRAPRAPRSPARGRRAARAPEPRRPRCARDRVQLVRRLADERVVAAARARAARTAPASRRSRRRRRPAPRRSRRSAPIARAQRQVRRVGVVVGRDRGTCARSPPRTRPARRRACSCRSGRPGRPGCPPASGRARARQLGADAAARSASVMGSGARSGGRGCRWRRPARSGREQPDDLGGVDDSVHGVHAVARQRQHGRRVEAGQQRRAPRPACSSWAFSIR